MAEVLSLITMNNNIDNNRDRRQVIKHKSLPYGICDIMLPQCNTGYVYMLILVRNKNVRYIEKRFQFKKGYNNIIQDLVPSLQRH